MRRFDSKVVDLHEFKAARASRQLDLFTPSKVEGLALSDGDGPAPSDVERPAPSEVERPAPSEVERPAPSEVEGSLSTRDLAHRARMLAHLEAVRQ